MRVLITGGAKGLGAAFSLALAEMGYSIAIQYKQSQAEALKVASQCRELGVEAEIIQGHFDTPLEVTDFIDRYLNQFSDTIGLINNVGSYQVQSALNTSEKEWLHLYQVNLHAPFMISKALVPELIKHKGQIINIGVCGLNRQAAHIYAAAYRLAKRGLLDLTLAMARELASDEVRVNMVSPGQLFNSVDLPNDLAELPMHRPATFKEVCRVVTFLFDPASAYLTGQNIEIAGGLGLS